MDEQKRSQIGSQIESIAYDVIGVKSRPAIKNLLHHFETGHCDGTPEGTAESIKVLKWVLGGSDPVANKAQLYQQLHHSMDVLMACYLEANPRKWPSNTTLTELMVWSYKQTLDSTLASLDDPISQETATREAETMLDDESGESDPT